MTPLSQVTLPSLPLPAPHNTFQPTLWRSSADEAKADAAGMVSIQISTVSTGSSISTQYLHHVQVLGLLRMSPDYLAMAATSAAIIRQPVDHLAAPGHGQVERHLEYL